MSQGFSLLFLKKNEEEDKVIAENIIRVEFTRGRG